MERIELTGQARMGAAGLGILAWLGIGLSIGGGIVSEGAGLSDALWAVVISLGFFTITTNLAVALSLTISLLAPNSGPGRFFRRPGVVTGLAASIALVAIVYELLLRQEWDPLGVALLNDLLVHYIVPTLYVLYWWVVTPKDSLQWTDAFVWFAYPLGYSVYVLVRGELIGHYPYPFLNVTEIGYLTVFAFMLVLGLFFLVLAWACIGLATLQRRRQVSP